MTFILLIGLLGMFLVILFKRPIANLLGNDNPLVHRLKNAIWFQNHWKSGIFLFVMNAALFFSTCLMLYVLTYFFIPFVHFVVMFLAVTGSIILWLFINRAWEGTTKNRLKMGALGSSFYLFMAALFVCWLVTLKPSYPGDDPFMAAIGLMFAIIVVTIAFITCFVMTGFSIKKTRLTV
ncbi:hypothetical protein RJP21_16165 [Paenibacillus sp. VCA1]|uniref:hypothetical protein n=1 Tax=Paenibacillus sp. VCA1 TaxID=3039148 RepID=UPI002870F490|nr:hypothetical protein [Paenibacillus sp. VCA1]MDR9855153.1 hypothetical protein [Paenibacillus sp. VCA1]